MTDTTTLLVLTTCGSVEEAENLARGLVEEHLAACVNVVPRVLSTYRWQGRVEHGEESLLVIKTTAARYADVERAIGERSSYELPEVLAIRAETGSAAYLDWIIDSVRK